MVKNGEHYCVTSHQNLLTLTNWERISKAVVLFVGRMCPSGRKVLTISFPLPGMGPISIRMCSWLILPAIEDAVLGVFRHKQGFNLCNLRYIRNTNEALTRHLAGDRFQPAEGEVAHINFIWWQIGEDNIQMAQCEWCRIGLFGQQLAWGGGPLAESRHCCHG